MKLLLCIFLLMNFALAKAEYMSSIIVSNADNKNVLGTASHICFSLNQDTLYFVTAAHVIEGVDSLEGSISKDQPFIKLKRIKVDSALDLAVLAPDESGPKVHAMGLMLPCHSTAMAVNPVKAKAFDVLASSDTLNYRLDIEGYDSETKSLRTETVIAPVVQSIQSGIPGRDKIDHIYMTMFKARPGFSGGLVLGYTTNGELASHQKENDYSNNPLKSLRREFLGLVVAADQSHNRVALIPGYKIMQWFWGFGKKSIPRENQITTWGGIYNKDLKYFLSTPFDSITSVGLSSFGGVGTGRPAVGSPKTGLILQEEKNKRWLSINDSWVEGDPINENTMSRLQNNRNDIQGIFENSEGQLIKAGHTNFPHILGIEAINKILKQKKSECSQIQMKNLDTKNLIETEICETVSPEKGQYKIKSKEFDVQIYMSSENGNVKIDASIGHQKAQATSLRRLQSPGFNIKIEGLSGLEIHNKKSGQIWVGPYY